LHQLHGLTSAATLADKVPSWNFYSFNGRTFSNPHSVVMYSWYSLSPFVRKENQGPESSVVLTSFLLSLVLNEEDFFVLVFVIFFFTAFLEAAVITKDADRVFIFMVLGDNSNTK
jgi:hypothetical protein